MELEKQVISLDLAKQLKELGVKQESLWWWCENKKDNHLGFYKDFKDTDTHKFYSAFTVAELGEILPAENEHKNRFDLVKRTPNKWEMNIFDKCGIYIETFFAKTEANVRAKMLCWLIKNRSKQ